VVTQAPVAGHARRVAASLSAADLYAAFLYYLDHSGEIDSLLQEADEAPEGAVALARRRRSSLPPSDRG